MFNDTYYNSLTHKKLLAEIKVRDGQLLAAQAKQATERAQWVERLRDTERIFLAVIEQQARILGGK